MTNALRWVLAAALSTAIAAQEFQRLERNGRDLGEFAVVTPSDYDAAKTYPVLLALPPGKQDRAMVEGGMARSWGEQAANLSLIHI